jgi:hypothetical protein
MIITSKEYRTNKLVRKNSNTDTKSYFIGENEYAKGPRKKSQPTEFGGANNIVVKKFPDETGIATKLFEFSGHDGNNIEQQNQIWSILNSKKLEAQSFGISRRVVVAIYTGEKKGIMPFISRSPSSMVLTRENFFQFCFDAQVMIKNGIQLNDISEMNTIYSKTGELIFVDTELWTCNKTKADDELSTVDLAKLIHEVVDTFVFFHSELRDI